LPRAAGQGSGAGPQARPPAAAAASDVLLSNPAANPPLRRRAYNGAFQAFGLKVKGEACDWPTKYYDLLQNTVAGGKGKVGRGGGGG
jgi:hypothetical protein